MRAGGVEEHEPEQGSYRDDNGCVQSWGKGEVPLTMDISKEDNSSTIHG